MKSIGKSSNYEGSTPDTTAITILQNGALREQTTASQVHTHIKCTVAFLGEAKFHVNMM